MRGIGAKGAIGIGLAIVLAIGVIGSWMVLRSGGDEKQAIVVGVTDTPDALDPAYSYVAGSWDLYSNVYQGLLTLSNASDQPVLDAAEVCEFTDNAQQVYRCTLREGLTFSSGRPVTPEDVQFSLERTQAMAQRAADEAEDDSIPEDEKFTYSGPVSLLASLEAVRVEGKDIIFELSEPDVTFPFVLAGGAGSIVDREVYELLEPREDGEVVGSGPYLLTDFAFPDEDTPGYAELEPNPEYQGAVQVSDYPITLRYYPGPEALQEAWESGEIEVNGGQMAPAELSAINPHDPALRYSETTGSTIRMLVNSGPSPSPASDETVRQSIAALLDRSALARQVHRHTVEPAYSLIPVGFTGHGTPYYDRYAGVDPDEVRSELTEAGHAVPVELRVGYGVGGGNAEEAAFVKEMLEADGLFEIELQEFPGVGGALAASAEGTLDSFFVGWRPDFSDADTYTAPLLTEDSVLAHGFSDPRIDRLISETRSQVQRGSTMDDFREIHEIAADAAVVIPLWQNRNIMVSDREITGLPYLRDAGGIFRLWELARL
ncbi:ABC transporter substrate-binding protein [Streptomyces sp. ACA25]|uniref:ABC transporter substrate-binding protein n=1 Tax=Streptomyces sp. ACA25 TaxID=3022596 RepID=UPI002306F797|nr:ABC transporter substrate-binding protein [Streptomyces sp. ACA25]MDB1087075.1 ABC transporter substrate-binding protein [Streptomyces sp. ACA25]